MKNILIWGTGWRGAALCNAIRIYMQQLQLNTQDYKFYFCDNDDKKWGDIYGYPILSIKELEKLDRNNTTAYIASAQYSIIIKQLKQYDFSPIYIAFNSQTLYVMQYHPELPSLSIAYAIRRKIDLNNYYSDQRYKFAP